MTYGLVSVVGFMFDCFGGFNSVACVLLFFWCCFDLLFRFVGCVIMYMCCLIVCFVVQLFCLLVYQMFVCLVNDLIVNVVRLLRLIGLVCFACFCLLFYYLYSCYCLLQCFGLVSVWVIVLFDSILCSCCRLCVIICQMFV